MLLAAGGGRWGGGATCLKVSRNVYLLLGYSLKLSNKNDLDLMLYKVSLNSQIGLILLNLENF